MEQAREAAKTHLKRRLLRPVRIDNPPPCDIGAFVTIQEAIMKLRTFGLFVTLVLGLLAGLLPAEAQQSTKVLG